MVMATGLTIAWQSIDRDVLTPQSLYAQQVADANDSADAQTTVARADELSQVFRNVAKTLKPAVVRITSVQNVGGRRGRPTSPNDFAPFFGGDPFSGQQSQPNDNEVQAGMGSGVIVSADGYVLTNNHVIKDADRLEVELSDERKFDARVIGSDPKSDLAVLKIETGESLAAAKLGDSNSMQVGDWVVAIGSPFGLSQTVTTGIISAKNRENFSPGSYANFLQTDAAINPGNSGGPLMNLRGEVIGINTAIASRSGSFSGIGFAIPSRLAKRVLTDIIENGRVVRGFIGLTMSDAEEMDGAKVINAPPTGPAGKAGLKTDDIITAVNGVLIADDADLRFAVADLAVGEPAEFSINRDGRQLKLDVTVEEQTEDKLSTLAVNSLALRVEKFIGIDVEPLDLATAKRLDMTSDEDGVMVVRVDNDSPLANDLSVGDVILGINRQIVSTKNELLTAMAGSNGFVRMAVRNERGDRLLQFRL
jgi:serine protease Do